MLFWEDVAGSRLIRDAQLDPRARLSRLAVTSVE